MSVSKSRLTTSLSVPWLSTTELSALERYIQRIRSLHGDDIKEIILFGSRMRGEGDEESDVDVAVIMGIADSSFRRRLLDIATELWLETGIKISPLVLSIEEFQFYLKIKRGFAVTIREEGVSL